MGNPEVKFELNEAEEIEGPKTTIIRLGGRHVDIDNLLWFLKHNGIEVKMRQADRRAIKNKNKKPEVKEIAVRASREEIKEVLRKSDDFDYLANDLLGEI